MQYNLSAPSAWQFVAGNGSDAVNSWGQPRAYAIVPTGVLSVNICETNSDSQGYFAAISALHIRVLAGAVLFGGSMQTCSPWQPAMMSIAGS